MGGSFEVNQVEAATDEQEEESKEMNLIN